MKIKRRELSYNEVKNLIAKKYNDFQNASINDSNYNCIDTEFSDELYDINEVKESKIQK